MVREHALSPSTAIRLHWRSGRVRSVTLPQGLVAVDGSGGLQAGALLRPLPATHGAVGSAAPAVNDAVLVAPTASAGGWPRWRAAALTLPGRVLRRLARVRGPALPVARIGGGRYGGRAASRWSAAWPYADGVPGGRNSFAAGEADHLCFAPDVIVDSSGRILRL